MFTIEDMKRSAVAVVGALVLSTTFVGAAVGPAVGSTQSAEAQALGFAANQASDRADG